IGDVDIVNEFEIGGGIDAMHLHQAAEGCAMLPEIALLKFLCFDEIDIQQLRYELAHLLVDPREEVGRRRIERVVEIEYPAVDMLKILPTWCIHHVLNVPPTGSTGKPYLALDPAVYY